MLRFLLLILLLLTGWYCWQLRPALSVQQPSPAQCAQQPLAWRLDTIDTAFALTPAQATDLLQQAADQWNQASGRTLLVRDDQHGFPVRFVFDERQQQQLEQLLLERNLHRYDDRISDQQQDFDQLLAEFQQKKAAFSQQDQQLADDIAAFNTKAQQADPGAAAILGRQQAELLSRQKEHALEAEQLDAEAEKLQDLQNRLNSLIADRNALIPAQQPAGLAEVGRLERQGNQLSMTIYAYKNDHYLLLTLLHEFGHALGIPHLTDADAVMHAQLNPTQQQLTAADISALQQHCLSPAP